MTDSVSTDSHGGRKAAMSFILIAVLIDMVSIGLIIPVLPPLVGTFASTPSEHTLAYLAVTFAFGIANFFGSPILGALSDRYGRRPVMLIGFSGLALSFFVTAAATALWMLVAVRLLSGAMQANAAVANAYVADITAPEDRAKRFGMLGAAFGMGFILGPVLGGLLGDINLHLPFYVAGTLALVNWAYGFFVLPESLAADHRRPFDWKTANPVSALKKLTGLKGVGLLVGVIALSGLAQLVLHTSWVLYTGFKFGWGPKDNGLSLFAVGVMSVLVQGFLLPRLLKRFSASRLVLMGLASAVLANLLWGAASQGWMMYAVIVINVLGFAASTALQSLISNAADAKTQGQTMGAVASLNSVMAVLAPVIGSGLMYFVAELPKGDWRIGAPFYFCAVLQLCSLLIAWRHFSRLGQAQALPQTS
ncbi:MFS transporter [Pelomonas sp. CA6]|uniref:MFS transporter n=1 Tax=Pelomonas sp. CA6 TaxID=2907999 RepID=UPI001F4BFB6B|nr:MFS transporter [Pelomonas sp. CA6]MCH7345774.1 MFS transporter [Pelomonas sp. CA6]